jgi:hypothetical protein
MSESGDRGARRSSFGTVSPVTTEGGMSHVFPKGITDERAPEERAALRVLISQYPMSRTNEHPLQVKKTLQSMDTLYNASFSQWVTTQDPTTLGRFMVYYSRQYSVQQLVAVVLFLVEKWNTANTVSLVRYICFGWLKQPCAQPSDLAKCCHFLNGLLDHFWQHQPLVIITVVSDILKSFQDSAEDLKPAVSVNKKYHFLMALMAEWNVCKVSTFLSYLGPAASLGNVFRVQLLQVFMRTRLKSRAGPAPSLPSTPKEPLKPLIINVNLTSTSSHVLGKRKLHSEDEDLWEPSSSTPTSKRRCPFI